MTKYLKGLHDIGTGAYAYLQPNGGWGLSNAGLIVDGDQSMLVDTLFDERLTAEMLHAMQARTGIVADAIQSLVNTHANGDHTHGNALVTNAQIIASHASSHEMAELPPQVIAQLMRMTPQMGEAGEYLLRIFGAFDFEHVRGRMPNCMFSGTTTVAVGNKNAHLIEVGPAHTQGDILVHVPADRVVFTGDILFIDGTPIMWAGPVANWLRACDMILAMDVDVIVPGHGPLTDRTGVRRVQDYLRYVDREARKRFNADLSAEDACFDIALGEYDAWIDAERIAVNVDTLYREYRGDPSPPDTPRLFALMGRVDQVMRQRRAAVRGKIRR